MAVCSGWMSQKEVVDTQDIRIRLKRKRRNHSQLVHRLKDAGVTVK